MKAVFLASVLAITLLLKSVWLKIVASFGVLGSLYSHEGCFDHSAISDILQSAGQLPVLYSGSADVLQYPGLAIINTAGVDAMTLATPVIGPQATGGDDGKVVTIIDNGGHAHTITTAANKIINSKHVATFGGTIGSSITFQE